MPPRLIINADDFGLTPGINRAIEELHAAQAITSASLMATGPAVRDAIAIALRNPTLGVGCHITLVDSIPVSHPADIPTLLGADGKTFRPSLLDFQQALLRNTIDELDIAHECQAQIQFLQRAGLDLTHVDTHKHTHVFPAVARPLLHVAQRCGIHAIRNPFEPKLPNTTHPKIQWSRRLQLLALSTFQPAFLQLPQLRSAELLTTAGTLGIALTGSLTAQTLSDLLTPLLTPNQPDTLYELCTHPGYHDAALDAIPTRLRASREIERLALLEFIPQLRRASNPPELLHYGNLGVAGLQRQSGQYTPNTGYEKVL